jgi:hypothetical protein
MPRVEMAGSCFENVEHQTHKTGTDVDTRGDQTHKTGTDVDTRGEKEKRSTQRNLEMHNRERKKRAVICFMGCGNKRSEG